VTFDATISPVLPWSFVPLQRQIQVKPGETALVFYRATNNSTEPIIGISSYNVTPLRAGEYFNKIQCFCFEEQRLAPGESVDMPIFFFVDAKMLQDPFSKDIDNIMLGYTFFNARTERNRVYEH